MIYAITKNGGEEEEKGVEGDKGGSKWYHYGWINIYDFYDTGN